MYSSFKSALLTKPHFRASVRSFILGIETSCDDTGVAVLDQAGAVLAERVHSQTSVRMGGVIPTFAMHSHARTIHHLVTDTLRQAALSPAQLAAVAVTNRPGLKEGLTFTTNSTFYEP